MFAVREFTQKCGERNESLVGESTFVAREEAGRCLNQKCRELNDGDFFEGEICERFESK